MASSGATKDGTTKLTSWASKGQPMRAAPQTRYLIKLLSILVPHGRSSFLAALVESDAQGSPAPRGGACGEGPANKWGTGAASALRRLMIFGCELLRAPRHEARPRADRDGRQPHVRTCEDPARILMER